MPWQEASRLLTPIARALAYAHQVGILHRDIKPANILITHSGEPMLSDFGLAKLLDVQDGVDLTGSTGVIGTPAYMAPEQMTGGKVDRRVDVYALGVVLYELVTGRTPYRADTPAAIMIKAVTEPLPRPTTFIGNLPENVEFAILKALEKEPENRFQTMEDFALALERFATERTPAAPAPAPTPTQTGAKLASASTMPAKAAGPESEPASPEAEPPLPEMPTEVEAAPVLQKPAEAAGPSLRQEPATAPKKKWPAWAISLASILGVLLIGGMAAGIYFLGGFGGNKNEPVPSPTVQQPPVFIPRPAFTSTPLPLARSILPYQFQEGDNYPPLQRFAIGWQNSLESARNWEVRLRANQSTLIATGWCASSADLLNQNFPHIQFLIEADGLPVDTKGLQMVEEPNAETVCRQFMGIIQNWPEGGHVLRMALHLDTRLNNGMNELPAGDYVNIFNVSVLPPTPLSLSIVILPYEPNAGDNTPTLRSLTPGYKLSATPRVQDWSLTVTADQAAILTQGWCSKTEKILKQNFEHIQYFYEFDGMRMDEQRMYVMVEQNDKGACRKSYGIIRYWPEGIHVIKSIMHLDADVNDGSMVIPAGDYVDIFNVLVLPPK